MNFRNFNHCDYGDIRVTYTSGSTPLFVAKDVAVALGYSNYSKSVGMYCRHSVLANELETKVQKMRLIPESDVYRLILRSKSKRAAEFQDWISEEVLPKLRGTSFVVTDGRRRQEQERNTTLKSSEEAGRNLDASGIGLKTEKRISDLEKQMAIIVEQIGIFEDIEKNYSTLAGYIRTMHLPIMVYIII